MDKDTIEKEFINISINDKTNSIKLDLKDDITESNEENGCDAKDEIPISKIVANKKSFNRLICYKCKKNKSNYFNRSEYVCKDCFFTNINHKFRSNLRVNCKIKHVDNVLLCISGRNNSMSMLSMFNYTFFKDTSSKRKLFFKSKILYIDDSFLYNQNRRAENIDKIASICKESGFPFEIIMLENALRVNIKKLAHGIIEDIEVTKENEGCIKELELLLNSFSKNSSFIEDFLSILKRNLIFYYSIKNNFTKVVFGKSTHSQTKDIFNMILKGRGFNLRDETEYIDDHYLNGKVSILYPMRDFLRKEIMIYNYLFKVEILYKSFYTFSSNACLPYNGNSNLLLNGFFNKLQEKSHTTASTVLNTCDRLKKKDKNISLCDFCLGYKDEVLNKLEIGSISDFDNNKIFQKTNLCFGCKRLLQNLDDELFYKIILIN